MGKQLILSPGGKYPGTKKTLKFISDAITDLHKALGTIAGYRVILSGVNMYTNSQFPGIQFYDDGYLSVDGKVVAFRGGQKYDHIEIVNEYQQEPYLTSGGLVNQNAYFENYARCVPAPTGNSFPFTELKRLKTLKHFTEAALVVDANYIHTDNNFTTLLKNKLEAIAPGAQANIQPDWNAGYGTAASILNMPDDITAVHMTMEFLTLSQLYLGFTIPHTIGHLSYYPAVEVQHGTGDSTIQQLPYYNWITIEKSTDEIYIRGQRFGSNSIATPLKIYVTLIKTVS